MSSLLTSALGGARALWPCRLCLKNPEGDDSSWSHLDRSLRIDSLKTTTTLRTIINSLTKTQIHNDDTLPQNICNSCVDSVIRGYLFLHLCEESEKRWGKLVNDLCRSTKAMEEYVKNRTNPEENRKFVCFLKTRGCTGIISSKRNINVKKICKFLNQKGESSFKSDCDDIPEFDSNYESEIKKKKSIRKKTYKRKSDRTYLCAHCPQIFIQKQYLITHLRLKHNILQNVECNDCGRKFNSISFLRRHVLLHRTANVYKCSICEETFNLASELDTHITQAHVQKDNFQCSQCPEKFCRKYDAKKHQMIFHNLGYEQCKHCGKKYQSLARLLNHEVKHKDIVCDKCGQKIPYPYKLKSHFERCAGKMNKIEHLQGPAKLGTLEYSQIDKTQYECETCNRKFSSSARLKYHLSRHLGVVCEKCGRNFKYKSKLKAHSNLCQKERKIGNPRSVEQPTGPAQFICDHCANEFHLKETLKAHIKSRHLFQNMYKCDVCDKRFSYKSGLKSHLVVHTRERSQQCGICGKYFVTKQALVYHMRLHTGERPFPCELCEERFLSASRRMSHVRKKHWGRTEECSICSSKFFTPYAMRKHMTRHFNPNSKLFCNKLVGECVQYNVT